MPESDEFPAFYARQSGLPVDRRVDSPDEAAAIHRAKAALRLGGGTLIAVPIPEPDALDPDEVERAVALALSRAEEAGQRGKDLTPYVLAVLRELTAGRSLQANLALLRNNAAVAAQIAVALTRDVAR